jgi:hypothetical protein
MDQIRLISSYKSVCAFDLYCEEVLRTQEDQEGALICPMPSNLARGAHMTT